MNPRPKRRRLSAEPGFYDEDPQTFVDAICEPAQAEEKQAWHGFCEIESEPALFNVMLREFGVKGVKVQEVVSLDAEMMGFLNQPVYGLIFLFRWREDDPDKQEAICPDRLWFANQTSNNSCASVALLNIVNNIDGIDLGDNLQNFKDFTMDFTPALRGDAINNFEFVKHIHNSFARKMDMFNADLQLKNDTRSKKQSQSSKKNKHDAQDDDGSFHFIAFVPVEGTVWKFDGLERQPQALGEYSQDDWLDLVRPNIITRMAEYEEDQIEFSILSLAKDPLPGLIGDLAGNVKCLEIVNERIATHEKENTASIFASGALEDTILGPDASYGLTQECLDLTTVEPDQLEQCPTGPVDELMQHRQRLQGRQKHLRGSIKEEQQSQRADEEYAAGRRFDYGPAVRTWIRSLARKGLLESLTDV